MNRLKELLTQWHNHPFSIYLALVAIAAFLTIALQLFLDDSSESSSPNKEKSEERVSADTYIPAGFVLVPIEIQNLRALDSILGQSGIVDLFLPPDNRRKKPILIKRRAKVLRAPNNPSLFATLVREEEAAKLLHADTPLFAVVQNPNHTNVVKRVENKQRKRRITFHDQFNNQKDER